MSNRSLANVFETDGFVCPIDILNEEETAVIAQDLTTAENELSHTPEKRSLLHSYPDRLLPSFNALIRHPKLLQAVSPILGNDLLVWSADLFIKEPNTSKIVSWHQDLTYWGLDDSQEVTAWLALSPSTMESGCMCFIPNSHKRNLVSHNDTFDDNNLLTRGQTISVDVDESRSVAAELRPGQASLHHGHLFHSSGPNNTSYRRIGLAIRYIKSSMRQVSNERSLVAHVSGNRSDHFSIAPDPNGRLNERDFALCAKDAALKREILFAGAENAKGKRY